MRCARAAASGCAVPKDRAGGDSQRGGAPALTTRTMLSRHVWGRRQSRRLPRLGRWLCCLSFGQTQAQKSLEVSFATNRQFSWLLALQPTMFFDPLFGFFLGSKFAEAPSGTLPW
jgi:hypothetical protein